MKTIPLLLGMLISLATFAQDNVPAGCQPQTLSGSTSVLNASKPVVFLIHNHSKTDLWLTHPVTQPNASAGWSSRIRAGRWSALALDIKSFELSCVESQPGHEQVVPCAGLISICKWKTVTLPKNKIGSYWAGEDMRLEKLTNYLARRGFTSPDTLEDD